MWNDKVDFLNNFGSRLVEYQSRAFIQLQLLGSTGSIEVQSGGGSDQELFGNHLWDELCMICKSFFPCIRSIFHWGTCQFTIQ
jgi:hypothetical protein